MLFLTRSHVNTTHTLTCSYIQYIYI
uniref:Uncharacterized protein n=1 Tax=Anguilla anguilla TaxID=7936 RepID=A0A0E9W169_ANGAN